MEVSDARRLGPLSPLADNDSVEGRQLNRRIEITIRPLFHLSWPG